jgi:SAM-dependent methyltransferase
MLPLRTTVIVTFALQSAPQARARGKQLSGRDDCEVLLAGDAAHGPLPDNARAVPLPPGQALRSAVASARGAVTVLLSAQDSWPQAALEAVAARVHGDVADVAVAQRARVPWREAALKPLFALAAEAPLQDPLSGLLAVRTTALQSLALRGEADALLPELLVKLSAQLFRVDAVPVEGHAAPRSASQLRAWGQALLRYGALSNDADNLHEGYNTLARMEGAPNYNAWLGERFRAHAGARVLEVGAGLGTITQTVDPFYVQRLQNRFRGHAHVKPMLSDEAHLDVEALRAERLDTVVLSNVLEHISDDGAAVRRFRALLPEGGKLLVLVPALPALFGSIDAAVGHHRRYTRESLRQALEPNGFAIEQLDWMNLAGVPGWFLSNRVFKRSAVPALQLKLFDQVAPLLARAEAQLTLPVGMSLFCVARAVGSPESISAPAA